MQQNIHSDAEYIFLFPVIHSSSLHSSIHSTQNRLQCCSNNMHVCICICMYMYMYVCIYVYKCFYQQSMCKFRSFFFFCVASIQFIHSDTRFCISILYRFGCCTLLFSEYKNILKNKYKLLNAVRCILWSLALPLVCFQFSFHFFFFFVPQLTSKSSQTATTTKTTL